MATGSGYFTASEVGNIITAEEDDDVEFIFSGSDDDFEADTLEEAYDPLQREQSNYTMS